MKSFGCLLGLFLAGNVVYGEGAVPIPELPYKVHDQERPLPKIVEPMPASALKAKSMAPKDAVILFDGKDLSAWKNQKVTVEKGYMELSRGKGSQVTQQAFGDCHLHLEWSVADADSAGNSGIYLMMLYEVQIFNSHHYRTKIYPDGQAASIYGQYPPLVNVCRPPGEWEYYDIHFTSPKWNDKSELLNVASITVFHNGVKVQDNVRLTGPTSHKKRPAYKKHRDKEPFLLQDHGNRVRFRNIWIKET